MTGYGRLASVAVVRLSAGGIPDIGMRVLDPRQGAGPIPGVVGAQFVPSMAWSGPVRRQGVWKAAARSVLLSGRMGALLGAEPSEAADCVCLDVSGHWVAFARTSFGQARSFAHLRSGGELPVRHEPTRVEVITGTCLFGGRTLRMVDQSGTGFDVLNPRSPPPVLPLVELRADDELSVYEHESTVRLTRTVADLAGAVSEPVAVTLDLPRVQYHFYLLDALERRMVDRELVLRWFDLVDRRNERLTRLFTDLIRAGAGAVDITVADPLNAIEPYLRHAVDAGTVPSLRHVLELLASSGDDGWAQLLTVAPPTSWMDLLYASYVVTPLRAVTDGSRALVVHIENYAEWPALRATRHALESLRTAGRGTRNGWLVGMYPMEQLVVTDELGHRIDPYIHDPGRVAVDPQGRLVTLADIVDTLYQPLVPAGAVQRSPE